MKRKKVNNPKPKTAAGTGKLRYEIKVSIYEKGHHLELAHCDGRKVSNMELLGVLEMAKLQVIRASAEELKEL